MDGAVMISDIAWIPRGIAKSIPDKVKLDDDQLKQLISGMFVRTATFCLPQLSCHCVTLPSDISLRRCS